MVITCPESVDVSALSFDSLFIAFSDGKPDVVIDGADEPAGTETVNRLDVGVRAADASPSKGVLRWTPGRVLVLEGAIIGSTETTVSVSLVAHLPRHNNLLTDRSMPSSYVSSRLLGNLRSNFLFDLCSNGPRRRV